MTLRSQDTLPCRHAEIRESVDRVKGILQELPVLAPDLLSSRGVAPDDYPALLSAAVESLRGTASATTTDKSRFIRAVLDYAKSRDLIKGHTFTGAGARQDHRVELLDGTLVAVEAKGCPDGNNMNIWDRPGWAQEFIVWSQCPESLVNQPGRGVWSGLGTRLLPKVAAERHVVDAMIFFDGRCGSNERRCPKAYGVTGPLRTNATGIPSQDDKERSWLPPPCIYLLPKSPPHIANNPRPSLHTLESCKFAKMLLDLFNVPEPEQASYVHQASIEASADQSGVKVQVSVRSRCWPDGRERVVVGRKKSLRRE